MNVDLYRIVLAVLFNQSLDCLSSRVYRVYQQSLNILRYLVLISPRFKDESGRRNKTSENLVNSVKYRNSFPVNRMGIFWKVVSLELWFVRKIPHERICVGRV